MRDNSNFPKSSFLMCLTTLRKFEDKEGYQVVKSEWKKCNGKEFRESFYEEIANGSSHTIEIVNQKPEKFVVNQVYMLATRDKVQVWVEE